MPAIEIEHLTKEYQLGDMQGLKQALLNTGARLIGKTIPVRPLFKALDDVSFSIDQGEVVGVIGHNGAGKSTLLKMLANISTPTRGSIKVNGRIAPLIEVGAGFVPNFTGRENVYLNGSILGMSRKDIDKKFDEIVEFAEMSEFIDTPVKRYSSGMKIKLAFSVATSVESEILIVDEVLAVGDIAFQRKCFDRMEELIKERGRTVLLVSHNIRQVERLCSRVILLDKGRVKVDDVARAVCGKFYEQSNAKIASDAALNSSRGHNLRMSGEVQLSKIEMLDGTGADVETLETGGSATIRAVFEAARNLPDAEVVFGFHTTDMLYIASMGTAHLTTPHDLFVGPNTVVCDIPRLPLVSGVYCLRVSVIDKNRREVFYGESLKIFVVNAKDIPVTRAPVLGFFDIPVKWEFPNSDESTVCGKAP